MNAAMAANKASTAPRTELDPSTAPTAVTEPRLDDRQISDRSVQFVLIDRRMDGLATLLALGRCSSPCATDDSISAATRWRSAVDVRILTEGISVG